MQEYTVAWDDRLKKAKATNPLTACKKCFPQSGWHWEQGRGSAKVYLNGKKVAECKLVDNG